MPGRAPARKRGNRVQLRLFVAGATLKSREALRCVTLQCRAAMGDRYDLEVIDVYQQPELARESQIIATPTLVKMLPAPVRHFIGSLANIREAFAGLEPAGR
jgi:circadian clock protein KaiB